MSSVKKVVAFPLKDFCEEVSEWRKVKSTTMT